MARVFISFAGADIALADELHQVMTEDGHEVFLDRHRKDGIRAGEDWKQRLYERLRWADVVVCPVTPAYVVSTWCFAEVAVAQTLGRSVLPLSIGRRLSHALLNAIQHIRYSPDSGRSQLLSNLRRLEVGGGAGWPDDRSPFPGLRPFEADLHQVFFGRGDDVKGVAALLRSPVERAAARMLLIIGPSGCGKSSLVRAGLIPTMTREVGWWALPPLTPTGGGAADPLRELARVLAGEARKLRLDWAVADVRSWLDDDGGLTRAAEELLLVAPGRPTRLLLVVDQFEELITRTAATRRARFAALLRTAVAGAVSVVGTLRPEFLAQVQSDRELASVPAWLVELRPLDRHALATVIEQPARLAGISVDPELVSRLIGDTGTGEALPLLAFTLEQLARGVTRGGRLSVDRYQELGGVHQALVGQAEEALAAATRNGLRSRDEVIAGLLRLVTVDEQGQPAGWRVGLADLPEPVQNDLAEFVSRRLLVTVAHEGAVFIAVAHEAFLSTWSPLAEAIAATATALRMRRSVELAAEEWDRVGRPTVQLWEGARLVRAVGDLATSDVALSPRATSFLRVGVRRARYRRTRAVAVLSILLVVALVAAVIAFANQQAAEHNQQAAEEQQRISLAQSLVAQADAIQDRDPRTALRLGVAAENIRSDQRTQAGLAATLTAGAYAGTVPAAVYSVAFALGGRTLATGSTGSVILWDITDLPRFRQIGEPLVGLDRAETLEFTPDGRTLVTAGTVNQSGEVSNAMIIWDVTDRERPRRIGEPLIGIGRISTVALSSQGSMLAVANEAVTLWDLSDPSHPRQFGDPFTGITGRDETVMAAAFTPDGNTLATANSDSTVDLWNVTDRAKPTRLGQPLADHHRGNFSEGVSVAFAPDGNTLVTSVRDNDAIVYDVTDRQHPRRLGQPLTGHTNTISSVQFAKDGSTLATGSHDNSVILWDLTNRERPRRIGQPFVAQTGGLSEVKFAPDDTLLATAGRDNTVVLWDLTNRHQPHRLGEPLPGLGRFAYSAAFAPTGRMIAVVGDTVELWDITNRERPRRLAQPFSGGGLPGNDAAFSPDGRTLATADDDGIHLWDVSQAESVHPVSQPFEPADKAQVSRIAFSPDGSVLAAATSREGMFLWDVTERERPRQRGHLSQAGFVFAPDWRTLASPGGDDGVVLWDMTDLDQPHRLDESLRGDGGVASMAFAPDGRTLAIGSSVTSTVVIWDLTDRERPRRLGRPLTDHTYSVASVAFAPDGRTLATGSLDATVMLWDMTDRERPRRLGQPLIVGGTRSVAFSPDGRTLASTAFIEHTAVLWDLTTMNDLLSKPIENACAMAGGGLTPDEWARHVPALSYRQTCP